MVSRALVTSEACAPPYAKVCNTECEGPWSVSSQPQSEPLFVANAIASQVTPIELSHPGNTSLKDLVVCALVYVDNPISIV